MKRRDVLKNLAAGSVVGVGTAASAGTAGATHVPPEQLDALYVKRGDEIVREVTSPTRTDVAALESGLAADERLVTPQNDCAIYCCEDYCPCSGCICACWCNTEDC